MKHTLLLLAALPLFLFAQNEKGVNPVKTPPSGGGGATRAVVIGISDYQDAQIPDLRFADRDAEAFAGWLRSPDGLALPDSQIVFLKNKQATTAQMIVSLDWLIEKSSPGDRAFIYFSGHGDVERVTKFQRGFLLTHDSPPAVYGAGAFSLNYLQDILSTLSQNEVQTFVITDACRAGKLAGTSVGGTQATAAQLAQQVANEVKILSCQPDEFSLEGEQWGGGRGCFSYHLEDALFGLADGNADATVDLRELRRYLEDRVSAEAAPQNQTPIVAGSAQIKIAQLHPGTLAAHKAGNKRPTEFRDVENRGLESRWLAKADSSVRWLYAQFLAAVDSGQLLQPAGRSADDFFKILTEKPEAAPLVGAMKRKLAAALMDEGQEFINQLLKNDAKTIDKFWQGKTNAGLTAQHLARAAELLGAEHYAYKNTRAKEYYFRSLDLNRSLPKGTPKPERIRLRNELIYKGLSFEPDAPYLIYPLAGSAPADSIDFYVEKLTEIAPNWVVWYRSMAVRAQMEKNDLDLAIRLYQKAIDIDSTFWSTLNWIAYPLEDKGEVEAAKQYREQAVRTLYRNIAADSTRRIPDELTVLGNALWCLRRYAEANRVLNAANKAAGGYYYFSYMNLFPVLCDVGDFKTIEDSLASLKKRDKQNLYQEIQGFLNEYINKDFEKAEAAYQANDSEDKNIPLVRLYLSMGCFDKAIAAIDSFPNKPAADFFLKSRIRNSEGNRIESLRFCDSFLLHVKVKYLKHDFKNMGQYLQKALAHFWLGQLDAMNETIRIADQVLADDPWHHFRLACFYAQTGQVGAALTQLDLAEKAGWHPTPFCWVDGTVLDTFLDPLRSLPEFQAWEKRWSPPYKDFSKD